MKSNKQQQYYIECPKTKKKEHISYKAYLLLTRIQKEQQEKQEITAEIMQNVQAQLTRKKYEGKTETMDITVQFTEEGKIDRDQLELDMTGITDPQAALSEFIECHNQAKQAYNQDVKSNLEKLNQAA